MEGQGVFSAHSLALTSGTLGLKRLREKGHGGTHKKKRGKTRSKRELSSRVSGSVNKYILLLPKVHATVADVSHSMC